MHPARKTLLALAVLALAALAWQLAPLTARAYNTATATQAPAFTHHQPRDWLNSKPLA